jgi:hypothetical protein
MKKQLNIVLECFSITPILDDTKKFQWLETSSTQQPTIEINSGIDLMMINIRKIKQPIDTTSNDNIMKTIDKEKLSYPFSHSQFLTFAKKLAASLTNATSWIKQLQYMKDYILAPLLISSKEIVIGIIILNNSVLNNSVLKSSDILESNIYLSKLAPTHNTSTPMEWKCDMLVGIITTSENQLSTRMKLYLMNCRSYLPRVIIRRMPKKITAIDNFRKHQTSARLEC